MSGSASAKRLSGKPATDEGSVESSVAAEMETVGATSEGLPAVRVGMGAEAAVAEAARIAERAAAERVAAERAAAERAAVEQAAAERAAAERAAAKQREAEQAAAERAMAERIVAEAAKKAAAVAAAVQTLLGEPAAAEKAAAITILEAAAAEAAARESEAVERAAAATSAERATAEQAAVERAAAKHATTTAAEAERAAREAAEAVGRATTAREAAERAAVEAATMEEVAVATAAAGKVAAEAAVVEKEAAEQRAAAAAAAEATAVGEAALEHAAAERAAAATAQVMAVLKASAEKEATRKAAAERQALLAAGYDCTPFVQVEEEPPVIISYAGASDRGRGEQHMWAVGSVLQAEGVNVYIGDFAVADQGEAFAEQLSLPNTHIFICMLSAEYLASPACRQELLSAAKENMAIIPVCVGELAVPLHDDAWFGTAEEDTLAGSLIRRRLSSVIPSHGVFQDDWKRSSSTLLLRVKTTLAREYELLSLLQASLPTIDEGNEAGAAPSLTGAGEVEVEVVTPQRVDAAVDAEEAGTETKPSAGAPTLEGGGRSSFGAFITHFKSEAAMEARFLQGELETALEKRVFLDVRIRPSQRGVPIT